LFQLPVGFHLSNSCTCFRRLSSIRLHSL
jgi:hypothetical protein